MCRRYNDGYSDNLSLQTQLRDTFQCCSRHQTSASDVQRLHATGKTEGFRVVGRCCCFHFDEARG